ncbi:olfactory receptor 2AP1-like [Anomaloglossus baeobatrachus]|uniref:olfactory receptor 2AP1-like n=1 Tax=Anomaloglossus baeobatrachus TaxID=238106 RepID=UPI003F50CA15
MNRRKCLNDPDNFCYVCGKFITFDQRKNLTRRVRVAYKYYFDCQVGDQDKNWAPHVCCTVCYSGLTQWLNGKRKGLTFAVPMVWREQKDHSSDCYFCMTKIAGYSKRNKSQIVYPDCESARKPLPHDAENPVPVPPSPAAATETDSDSSDPNKKDDAAMMNFMPKKIRNIGRGFVLYKLHNYNKTMVTEFLLLAFADLHNLQILLFVFVLLAYLSCVVGNSVILVLVRCERSLHTPMYFFIAIFALLEILFVSVIIPKLLLTLIEGNRKISFIGCFAQFYTFGSLGVAESYLLVVMGFDRDLAINKPLHYSRIMNNSLFVELAVASWVIGLIVNGIPVTVTAELDFCGPNEINHYLCDFAPLQNLACSDPTTSNLVTSVAAAIGSPLPFLIILGFYIHIITLISKIKSTRGKQKAFSTCSSHLTVACLFYGSTTIVYVKPKGNQHDRFIALIYTVIVPFLNPFIYTLKNQDVKTALKNLKLLKFLGQIRTRT